MTTWTTATKDIESWTTIGPPRSAGALTFAAPIGLVSDGDSITVGFGTTFPEQGYPSYFSDVSNVPTHITAISGELLANMNSNYSTQVAPFYSATSMNCLSVLGGTNDLNASTTAVALAVIIQSYCAQARATGFKVYVATVISRSDTINGWNDTKEAERVAYNLWLVDNWESFADGLIDFDGIPETHDGDNATYFSDQLHPTAALQAIMGTFLQTTFSGVALSAPQLFGTPIFGLAQFIPSLKSFETTTGGDNSTGTTVLAFGAITGKKVFAFSLEHLAGDYAAVGVSWFVAAGPMGFDSNNSIAYYYNGGIWLNNSAPGTGPSYTTGAVVGAVVDETNGKLWFTLDGVNFYGTGGPLTSTQVVARTGGLDISAVKAVGGQIFAAAGSLNAIGQKWRIVAYPYAIPSGYTEF